MDSDIIKNKKKSKNFIILLLFFYGYLLYSYIDSLSAIAGFNIPVLPVATAYYLILSVAFRNATFGSFVMISFSFISFYFSFISFGEIGIKEIWESFFSDKIAISFYYYLLLPFGFLGFCLDFYSIPKELSSFKGGRLFLFFVPILIKRELILQRFNAIMDAFQARGIDTSTGLKKYLLLPKWIIPLVVTTILEGIESYEYNNMLKTNILSYRPEKQSTNLTKLEIVLLLLLPLLIVLKLFHE